MQVSTYILDSLYIITYIPDENTYVHLIGNYLYLRQAPYLQAEHIFFKLKWVSQFLLQSGLANFCVKRLKIKA